MPAIQMSEIPRYLLSMSVSLAGAKDDDGRTWNQIAYEGQWKGHSAGEFQFTRDIFDHIVEGYGRRVDDAPLTWGHPDGETGSYMGAAGWIRELKVGTDDEGRVALFALMEFSARAASMVKAGEHRHCSVVVGFDGIDEKTGEPVGAELYEVGLVLAAFVDGMTRLVAGRTSGTESRALAQGTEAMLEDIIKQALKELPEGFTSDQLFAYIAAEEQKAKAIAGEGSEEPAAEEPAEEPAEDVAASSETPKDAVELADTPDGAEGAEPSADEAAGSVEEMFLDWAGATAEASGLDLAAFFAALTELDIAGQLGAQPEDGTQAEEAAPLTALSKSHSTVITALATSEKTVVDLSRAIAERDERLERAEFKLSLSEHVRSGAILDEAMNAFMEMSTDVDYGDLALSVARKALAKTVKDGGQVVPLKRAYAAADPESGGPVVSQKEAMESAEVALLAEYAEEGKERKLGRSDRGKIYQLAKKMHPEAFGIKVKG